MRYNLIREMDISNGPGLRVSIFMQGCSFHCKNCFNQETWDFDGGKEFTDETIEKVLDLCSKNHIKGLSILGGEPMHPRNIEATTKLAKAFKEKYPNKTLWVWSGFTFDKDLKDKEVLKYIDVLVDGTYIDELHDFTLKWKGSSNQRVIDVQKSLKNKEIVYYTAALALYRFKLLTSNGRIDSKYSIYKWYVLMILGFVANDKPMPSIQHKNHFLWSRYVLPNFLFPVFHVHVYLLLFIH